MMVILVAAVLLLAGWAVLWRMPGCDGPPADSAANLSIIIPARNEADNLPVLLRSLNTQAVRPGEIIVVDDSSTDGTAEIAAAHGARVLPAPPLPQGWGGKTWACQQGADASCGELLLFLDADTWLEDGALPRILGTRAAHGGVLSVGPYHAGRRPHEQLSAFFNLIMTAGVSAFTLWGRARPPRGLFGQMMLVPRADYQAAGGHAAVRGRNVENLCLAEIFRARGVPLRCTGGRGVFSFRMYPRNTREVVAGWTKGFAAGAGQTPRAVLLLTIAWLSGLVMPVLFPVAGDPAPASWWAALYAAAAAQVYFQLRRVGSFHWLTALLYPVPLVFFFIVFTRSLLRNRLRSAATWKGRRFDAA
jgi:4,4'-diaponeurosporenoate glycosyltransferase